MKTQRKIELNMSDKERANIIKRRILTIAPCDSEKAEEVKPGVIQALKAVGRSKAFPLLATLCSEFGIVGEQRKFYENATIELAFNEFAYSGRSLAESTRKQGNKSFDDMAKMFTCFDDVVKNAVGIEAHRDRYGIAQNIDGIFVLMSAFSDENRIVPVKLEVKSFCDATKQNPNALYVAVSRSPIEKVAIKGRHIQQNTHPQATSVTSPVTLNISISKLIKKVNTSDGDLLKYLPKRMLKLSQRHAADDARAAEQVYIKKKLAERGRRLAFSGGKKAYGKPLVAPSSQQSQHPLDKKPEDKQRKGRSR